MDLVHKEIRYILMIQISVVARNGYTPIFTDIGVISGTISA
jgi:hypothetical protein